MAGFIRLNSPRNLTDFMEHLDFWLIHWRARQSKAYCRSLVTSQQKTHSDFVVTQKRGRKEQPKKAIMVHRSSGDLENLSCYPRYEDKNVWAGREKSRKISDSASTKRNFRSFWKPPAIEISDLSVLLTPSYYLVVGWS